MVYVDDMYTISLGRFGRMKMSHMIADTKQELLDMADKIGLNKKWIQCEGDASEHFDVSISMRKAAITNGAKAIPMRELARMTFDRRISVSPVKYELDGTIKKAI